MRGMLQRAVTPHSTAPPAGMRLIPVRHQPLRHSLPMSTPKQRKSVIKDPPSDNPSCTIALLRRCCDSTAAVAGGRLSIQDAGRTDAAWPGRGQGGGGWGGGGKLLGKGWGELWVRRARGTPCAKDARILIPA